MREKSSRKRLRAVVAVIGLLVVVGGEAPSQAPAQASGSAAAAKNRPWMDKSLPAERRAELVLGRLTLEQKVQLLHGTGDPHDGPPAVLPEDEGHGGSGYVPGFPELGIPGLWMDDSAIGVGYSGAGGRYATALPANIGLAATWDPGAAERYGALIGRELRAQGYNMSLGGGVDLTREPRDARTFEYEGEDPVLAGTMVGHLIRGVQGTHVVGDIKHYAVNDQEDGRHALSSEIGERAMRETDLLAFQIGIEVGQPGAVMCAYNRVNGVYACENDFLLRTVLKGEWGYPGFVVSDWLATHSTVASSRAGLDQEQPTNVFYGPALLKAVRDGKVPMAEVDDHARRVLRSMFAEGVVDDPPVKMVPDAIGDARVARELAGEAAVLLRNEGGVLPVDAARVRRIAVIGRAADKGVISGGGSAQVDPPGGNAIGEIPVAGRIADWQRAVWFNDAPLRAVREAVPGAEVVFDDGSDPARAAAVARGADVALVFAYQWMAEGMDLKTLGLPDGQDGLIAAVAKANPKTVVVLETGGPVLMPWVKDVAGVVEMWYGGTMGGTAAADVLFGRVNPGGKLPVTFPLSDADLPHPELVGPPKASQEDWSDEAKMSRKLLAGLPAFSVRYDEGLKVGYRWYDAERKPVLFPFGFGMSYTSFAYDGLRVETVGDGVRVRLRVKNTGGRAGAETAEIYATMPAGTGEPPKRLVGWSRVELGPGEAKEVEVEVPRARFAVWDEGARGWRVPAGRYAVMVGGSSAELPLRGEVELR